MQEPQRVASLSRLPSAWLPLSVLLAAGLALAVARVPILTPDVWWHLATGKYIAAHGIPHTDPFSYTLAGRAWIAHEWLADVVWARAFAAGDLQAVVWLRIVLVLLAWWGSYRLARLHASRAVSLLWLLPAIWVSQRNWLDRPQLWSFLLLPWLVFFLERTRLRPRRWMVALPLLFVAWVNLHGGFMLGLVLLAGWTAAPYVARRAERDRGTRLRLLLLIAAFAATLINPYGIEGVLYPLGYVGSGLSATIQEEKPGTLSNAYAWIHLGLVVTAGAVVIARRRRLPLAHGWILAVLAWLSMPRIAGIALPFAAERHAPLFLHAAVPLLAWYAGAGRWQRIESRALALGRTAAAWVAVIAIAGFGLWQVQRSWPRPARPSDLVLPGRFPIAAADWIARASLPERLLNPYRWGGYLAFRLYPQHSVWIDSRGDLYGAARLQEDEVLHRFAPALAPVAARLIARDDPDVIVWPLLSLDFGPLQVHPFTRWIAPQRSDWRLIYFDGPDPARPQAPWATTAVFLRVHPRNADWLERLPAVPMPAGLPL